MKRLLIALCAGLLCACSAVDDVRYGIKNTTHEIESAMPRSDTSDVYTFDEDAEYILEEPRTVLDNEYLTVTLDSIVKQSFDWYYLNVTYVNKTDQTIYVTLDTLTVNDVGWSCFAYDDVAKYATYARTVSTFSTAPDRTSPMDNIRFHFTVEGRKYDTLCVSDEAVYLNGEENAVCDLYEIQDTDKILVDNDYVTIVDLGDFVMDGPWLYRPLYAFNKTDKWITSRAEETLINDMEGDLSLNADFAPNSGTYFQLEVYEGDLEECGLTPDEVTSMKLRVSLRDEEYRLLSVDSMVVE